MQSFHTIAVIGLGLIGASFAAACKENDTEFHIIGVDTSRETRDLACEKAWVDEAYAPNDPALKESVLSACDLVVLCVPAVALEGYFKTLSSWGYSQLITDTTSTKAQVCSLAETYLTHPECFIPGHPMAGSEVNGIEGARADLFKGAHWILCPDENTSAELFQKLHTLITSLDARVVSLPREDHDRSMAIVSHVPHLVASSLMQLASAHADDSQTLFRLAAGGFKDSTRIAAGSSKLWTGISFENAPALIDGLAEMRDILFQFESALRDGDDDCLLELLEDAAQARKALPAAWVPSTDRLLEVRIPMENRKGVVAEVTTIASQVGCNILSIEIDHITEDSAVLSLVLTDEGDVGCLSTQLIEAGFSVSFSPLGPKEHVHVE